MNSLMILLRRTALVSVVMVWVLAMSSSNSQAQGPEGRSFGFGIVLIDPFGATVKIWTNPVNAFVFDIGASHFGPTRLDGSYAWHFDPFQSSVVKMYAAPGIALAFGSRGQSLHHWEFNGPESGVGVGVRAMFGLNIIPKRMPLEFFLELGPLIGLSPTGVALDAGLGIRFYP